jgi:para-aminobenzoate synthetase component 1
MFPHTSSAPPDSPESGPGATPSRTVLRFGPGERGVRASAPARTLIVTRSRELTTLSQRIHGWFDQGIQLVCGALAYEAGAGLHGLDADHAGEPLAVIHGYEGYQHSSPDEQTAPDEHHAWQITAPWQPGQSEADYERSIAAVRDYLHAGDCYQVNLAQALRASFRGDPMGGWQRLMNRHPAPFAGYLEWAGGALLSASPERFLAIRDGQVLTEPIKGTRPRGNTEAEDRRLADELSDSAKDHAENLMIVDLLRNDLGRVCRPGSIRVPELAALHRYSNVQHLVSRVEGELCDGVRPLDALLACFPGGSITGAPKKRAMEIIAELEPVPRGFYCGSMFWQTADGDFDSNILIRTLQAGADGSLSCHGGGGIVADSDPAAEYEETLAKIRGLMGAVGACRALGARRRSPGARGK